MSCLNQFSNQIPNMRAECFIFFLFLLPRLLAECTGRIKVMLVESSYCKCQIYKSFAVSKHVKYPDPNQASSRPLAPGASHHCLGGRSVAYILRAV